MLSFMVANLITDEDCFDVPSQYGGWHFSKAPRYNENINHLDKKCANTFIAEHSDKIFPFLDDNEFPTLCDEMIDTCLILSFLTAKCVSVSGCHSSSDVHFVSLGDKFIRPRAIAGFPKLDRITSLNDIFAAGIQHYQSLMKQRLLRLFISHWISALTCFTMEDIFAFLCIDMDIVKQCELLPNENDVAYFEGMKRASARYKLNALTNDYKNMRNDLIHYGMLSAKNNPNKSKGQCANIIADVLGWIDSYVLAVLSMSARFRATLRWRQKDIENGLPSISLSKLSGI